ncbi:MAG TPA: hypothetical protein VJ862_11840 [Rhodanobacteraceae bacterium]|nr:hypothetical protein [Rhodanobacteraceae bacterium]
MRTATAAGEAASRFTSQRWGFSIDHPADWQVRRGFRGGYLATGAWKTYAAPGSHGTPVVALEAPGSDHITAAEIRIGASRSPPELARCMKPPNAVRAGSIGDVRINGIHFTRFDAGNAAMSHYLDVRSYRSVHEGACYAVDLLVCGTNPGVYSPPATPPFTREQAFAKMQQLLRSFRFTSAAPPGQATTSGSTPKPVLGSAYSPVLLPSR